MLALIITPLILYTKLSTLSWTIYHLWIIVISLSIYLMSTSPFLVLLLNNFICILLNCLNHLLSFLNYLTRNILIFKIFKIIGSWSDNCFLRISRAYIIIAMSFCTCYSVSCSILRTLLVGQCDQLLWVLVLHHYCLLLFSCLRSILVKWNMNSSIGVT
jgi:hypothetical protein